MIDFILLCFVAGVFYAGFWCGAKFGTLKNMVSKAKAQLAEILK